MKRLTAILAVLMILIAAGCQQQTSTSPPAAGKAFVGGTQGLVITFLDGLPPAQVFDTDNPFQIGVKIENKGEFSIQNAQDIKVSITGINPSDFKVSSADLMKSPDQGLAGVRTDASGNIVAGDYTTIQFPQMNYFTTVNGAVPFTIRANVCYEYGTTSQGKLCVRKDLRGVTGEAGICDPNRAVPADNSGAPIQITNFRQNVAGPNKIDFFFTIKNSGASADTLYKTGTSCDPSISNRDIVYVTVADTGLGDLTCYGLKDGNGKTTGYTTLFSGQTEVRCTQTVNAPDDFEKVMQINLRYGYKQFVDRQIQVVHAATG